MSDPLSAPRLPLSPASPPESGLKPRSKEHVPPTVPRTPPLADQMSVATKSYVPFSHDGRHTNEMASRSPDLYVNQPQRSSVTPIPNQLQNSLKRSLSQDQETQPASKRQRVEDTGNVMEIEPSYAVTNHDRRGLDVTKPEHHTAVNLEKKHVVLQTSQVELAELDSTFKDVGPALLIRKTTRQRAAVNVNDHLLGKYGLHSLLSSVARIDPSTGEKANKLRKSYEGQIKSAALPGRNRPYKEPRADDEPSKLMKTATIPENVFKESQEQRKPGDLEGLRGTMQSALRLNSGTMNRKLEAEWDDILGHEVKKQPPPSQVQPSIKAQQPKPALNGVQHSQFVSAADKVKTRGKRRVYTDAGFEGYQGFADGWSDPENPSDGDRDYNDKGKKRRKE